MSLPLAIAVIVLLDAALLGLLVFVMSHASRLTPHAASAGSSIERRTPAATRVAIQPAHPSKRAGRISTPAVTARS